MEHNPNYCKCTEPSPDTENIYCTSCSCVIQPTITKIEIGDIEDGSISTKLIEYNDQCPCTVCVGITQYRDSKIFEAPVGKFTELVNAFDEYTKTDIDNALTEALIKFQKQYILIESGDLQTFVLGWNAAIEFINNEK